MADEPTRSGSISGAKKEGYLTKEGWKVKNWKKRWFVLGLSTLSYYKTHKSLKKVLGVIPLREVTQVAPVQHKRNANMLQVVTPRRTYLVYAESRLIMAEWLQVLTNQVEIAQGRRQAPTQTGPSGVAIEGEEDVTVDSFEPLQVIGQGSFGKVLQVRNKTTGDIYAMKVLNKKNIVERGEVEHTLAERSILTRVNHPFLMKLHWSFQSADKLYLVMDFVNGGELFYHLQHERKFGNERARFYTAEIVLGIEHLHQLGIIYRDLKPENLLLDESGHIKMTDFGLSKEGLVSSDDRTNTFCGTPEYLAPEVLDGKLYTKSVDWWSLGTLIFEMLTGLPPFYDEDVQRMYTKKMTADLQVPDYVDGKAADLIRLFLNRNPETRLQDVRAIKSHPWFSPIDWEKLGRRDVQPPWRPPVSSKESTKLIDQSFLKQNVKDVLEKPSGAVSDDQFEGFTYQKKAGQTTKQ